MFILYGMPAEEWGTEEFAQRYLSRADGYPRREEGGGRCSSSCRRAGRVLDLGSGDGRPPSLVLHGLRGVGVDFSPPMPAAADRFGDDPRVERVEHDLAEPPPALGPPLIVSSFAIHHLEDDPKRRRFTARPSTRWSSRAGCSPTSSTSPRE